MLENVFKQGIIFLPVPLTDVELVETCQNILHLHVL